MEMSGVNNSTIDQNDSDIPKYNSLSSILSAQKGNLKYEPNETFLLHVFWIAPSINSARELLSGLAQCATATHRDTPCVPTYFFRISSMNRDLCPAVPRTVGDHIHLGDFKKRVQRGVPLPAVQAQMIKLGLDPNYLNLDVNEPLPVSLQQQPVALEFTEIYLDDRAFYEHAGSTDYLAGHGKVMNPSNMYGTPLTVCYGTPTKDMMEKIIEPVLKAQPLPLYKECYLFKKPVLVDDSIIMSNYAYSLSLDIQYNIQENSSTRNSIGKEENLNNFTNQHIDNIDVDITISNLLNSIPSLFHTHCTSCIIYEHPLRPSTFRLFFVMISIPSEEVLLSFKENMKHIMRGEIHIIPKRDINASSKSYKDYMTVLNEAYKKHTPMIQVNDTDVVGYILHDLCGDLKTRTITTTASL